MLTSCNRRRGLLDTRALRRPICSSTPFRPLAPSPSPSPACYADRRDEGTRDVQQTQEDKFDVPQSVLDKNAALVTELKGKVVLAPLTRGGSLPFRRLCGDFGASVTMSEMAFARSLVRGDRVERARLHKADNEHCFGVQIATKAIAEGVAAARIAQEAGARWVDINCGCPIFEASRKGLGAAMLRKPRALAKLVHAMAREADLPITVKVRTGVTAKDINVDKVVSLLQSAGAAAVTVHGRTMEQRYKRAADWDLIRSVTAAHTVPIIGNGDILTQFEAQDRLQNYGCCAVLVGRGALTKPWIFKEVAEGREIHLDAVERVGVYRQLVAHMKEHFGNDARGRRSAFYFLPLNLAFLSRYRHLPHAVYGASSREQPLILTRMPGIADPQIGESLESLPLLERLLRCAAEEAQAEMAAVLWDSTSDADAVAALETLAASPSGRLAAWESHDPEGRDSRDERGRCDADQTEAAVDNVEG